MDNITQEKAKLAALKAMVAVAQAIVDMPQGVPSGHLYAVVMGSASLTVYQTIIDSLVNLGFVTNKGHLLQATDKGRQFVARMGGMV